MTDTILAGFLRRQAEAARELEAASDLVKITVGGASGDRFVVELSCRGLVARSPADVRESGTFACGVWFPPDYLRAANPFEVVTWLFPRDIWHPNIAGNLSRICIGRLAPGTPLVDLIYQVHAIVTWNKVTMREDDALNAAACQWARGHADRYPVDRRPLKRRAFQLAVTMVSGNEADHGG